MGIIRKEIEGDRRIITLSGSTRFMKEFKEVEMDLTLKGEIVLPPAIYGKSEGITYPEKMARELFELHLDKIRISNGIFVIDVGGYIGESTKKEIDFAKSIGKSVEYYSETYRGKNGQHK